MRLYLASIDFLKEYLEVLFYLSICEENVLFGYTTSKEMR